MGDRFDRRSDRQHPDLSRPATDGQRVAVLTLLALDGVLCAIAAALFLPLRIATMPFPISALIAGLVNAALVWAALHWTSAPRVASVPLWSWLLTVALLSIGGPGDDVVFGGSGVMAYAAFLLIALGALPPAFVLYRYADAGASDVDR